MAGHDQCRSAAAGHRNNAGLVERACKFFEEIKVSNALAIALWCIATGPRETLFIKKLKNIDIVCKVSKVLQTYNIRLCIQYIYYAWSVSTEGEGKTVYARIQSRYWIE